MSIEPLDYERPTPRERKKTKWLWIEILVVLVFFVLWLVVLPLWYTWSMRDF
jgi:hypothetical protein